MPTICQWFLLCENHATTTRAHPVLGAVPICGRCNDKVNAITDAGERERRAELIDRFGNDD